ncbi:MAG: GIY-YIG nuclease family protein [Chitinophagaceae bacterium]
MKSVGNSLTDFLIVMFTVYVLYSKSFEKIYIGYTSDLSQRLLSHNELSKKGWTIKFRPWIVAHREIFETKAEAMLREKQLKTAKGREWLWNIISKA